MRAIADRAGLSLGSSYHYFPSKEHLVLQFYKHLHELHLAAIGPVLAREKKLAAQLREVIRAVVVAGEEFHEVSGAIFSTVADPRSPLNPFGPQSRPLREEVISIYAEVVAGSDARLPDDVRAE